MNSFTPPEFNQLAAPVAWWAARTPDQLALVDGTGTWTYAQLNEAIIMVRDTLLARGTRPGDRVGVLGDNGAPMVALMLGASLAGAWVMPLNPRLTDREIDEVASHATPACLLFAHPATGRARQHAQRYNAQIITIEGLGPIAVSETSQRAAPELNADVAALIYTSGTTGQPKGVMLTHRNLLISARASGAIRKISPADIVYSVLPISHILGFTGVMLGTLTYGGTIRLAPRFDPPSALRAILHDHITIIIGAPSMFALLAEYAALQGMTKLPPHRLRLIASAGAPLDPAVKAAVEACFGMVLNNGYGITECAPTIAQTRIDRPRRDCSVGMLLPGLEARLDGEAGGIGALHLRGPTVMAGYYRDEAATAAVLDADGWFDTGDLATFEDDHLFIVGRTKEQIIRYGFKIYPAEIEAVLNAYPGVRQSAVIGRGDGAHQDVIAFVEPAAGATLHLPDLIDYTANRLADYKRPAEIRLAAALPMGATGKVQKSLLIA
ncbi:acyl--CoA ligase [Acidiphilium sp. PA]|uniref:class I adenylate-forming enzyme family protein n=1 Tax=Acidiphilium sp. PA TaxID=2871705 RepID=UPI0022435483|nr:class I adenylate-forming enzyme family protein [Acidiphilium sp. PA]MCW8308612.1 acyl--CoA ligase [Acidiphilium sp. PA]